MPKEKETRHQTWSVVARTVVKHQIHLLTVQCCRPTVDAFRGVTAFIRVASVPDPHGSLSFAFFTFLTVVGKSRPRVL